MGVKYLLLWLGVSSVHRTSSGTRFGSYKSRPYRTVVGTRIDKKIGRTIPPPIFYSLFGVRVGRELSTLVGEKGGGRRGVTRH